MSSRADAAATHAPALRWRILRAGGFLLDGGGMFGLIPRTIWGKWVQPDALNRIPLAMNCVLLERSVPGAADERILIETGAGGKWTSKERALYAFEARPDGAVRTVEDALTEQGIDPASIAHIIVTHLHFDHAGGLTRWNSGADAAAARAAAPAADAAPPEVELAFPNAAIHVQRREWLDALDNRSTMTRTYLRSHLDPIAQRVVLHDGPTEVLPGIHVRPLLGHTWGQQGVFWRDHLGELCFPADLLPTIHHAHPAASLGYDMLPYDTMLTKRALLQEAQDKDWRLVLDHEPGPCVVRARDGRLIAQA